MTWVRIESGFFRHRKVIDLRAPAKMLFLGGLCYAAENSTDGFISHSALRILCAEVVVKPATATELVRAGLWHKEADGFTVHDYLEYQPSAEQERQRRQETADRVKSWRESKKARRNSVRNAPGNTVTTGVSNAVTDPVRNGVRTPVVTLSPNPNPLLDTSPPLQNPVLATGAEEEDPATREARQRLATRTGPPILDPEKWVAKVANQIRTAPPAPPSPLERSAQAQRERDDRLARRERGDACPTCDDLGVTEQPDGSYNPCPTCT